MEKKMDDIKTSISGELVIGLDFNGRKHKNFTIGLATVKDTFEAQKEGGKDQYKIYLALIARRIEKLGGILKENINAELLLNLYDIDLEIILEKQKALDGSFDSFREQFEATEKVSTSTS